jgi:hypothetical protein
MMMNMHDVIVESINGNELIALCTFSAFDKEWPSILTREHAYWKFEQQAPLQDWHHGNYAGRAKYTKLRN